MGILFTTLSLENITTETAAAEALRNGKRNFKWRYKKTQELFAVMLKAYCS